LNEEFLKHVPVARDDTKLVDGYPGGKVFIACRKGNQWYIGGLNGKDEPQALETHFDFLGKGNYLLQLIKDGNDSVSFSYDSMHVKNGDIVKVDCLPRGGFVGILKVQDLHT
jgi:hypothetical protein